MYGMQRVAALHYSCLGFEPECTHSAHYNDSCVLGSTARLALRHLPGELFV